MDKEKIRPYLRRLGIVTIICTILIWMVNEISFQFMNNNIDRGPQTIELIIPEGTAALVAAGQAVPAIPAEMIFVLGDVLVVINQDVVDHELGPIFVPPGTSASLSLTEAAIYSYDCSFSSSSYLGLVVKDATTWVTRLTGLAFSVPPTVVFVFLYSLIAKPIQDEEESQTDQDDQVIS